MLRVCFFQMSLVDKGGVELLIAVLLLHRTDLRVLYAVSRALLTTSRGDMIRVRVRTDGDAVALM
jgi:hypothetical protein